MKSKINEISDELKKVFFGKYKFLDFVLPPVLFFLAYKLTPLKTALFLSLLFSILILAWRLKNKESLLSLLLGIIGIIVGYIYSYTSNNATGVFLPSIVTDALIATASIISVFIKKPLVAYTSHFTHRWPINWYLHPKVRPAYSEVTILWFLFFSFKSTLELIFLDQSKVGILTAVNIITGWPGMITLLITSYLWGQKRLQELKGPSVEEFKKNKKPPWKGQRRGF